VGISKEKVGKCIDQTASSMETDPVRVQQVVFWDYWMSPDERIVKNQILLGEQQELELKV
jgi:hypothetical protein